MKLSLSLLKTLIDIDDYDLPSLRHLLDDVGLEVEQIVDESGKIIIKIETLAHRGDHLSAYGVARELSARLLRPLKTIELCPSWPPKTLPLSVLVETDACLRYALMELTLPKGMSVPVQKMIDYKEQNPAIINLLNYILEEIGQPMHAFDADCIEGGVQVVVTSRDEEIIGLDEKTYRVPAGSIVIRDSLKILAVAGVIGCKNSMVTATTKRVLIESAAFDPVFVRKTAKVMGLSTGASYVFERGSDRELVITALRRLVSLIPGVDFSSLSLFYAAGSDTYRKSFSLDISEMAKQLHMPALREEEVMHRLSFLGYTNQGSSVVVPSWRERSIYSPMAIMEDFSRSYGLNAIPLELPPLQYEEVLEHPLEKLISHIEPVLVGQGFCETITKSYYSNESVAFLEEVSPGITQQHLSMKNSVEKDFSFLKVTNCIHFGKLVEANVRKGVESIKVFECGRTYDRLGKHPLYEFEKDILSLAFSGRWYEGEWKKPETTEESLMYFKGVLEALIRAAGGTMTVGPSNNPYLHPHVQSAVCVEEKTLGTFGLLHPVLRERLGLDQAVLYAELDMTLMAALCNKTPSAGRFSEFPASSRDVTVKVPRGTPAGAVITTMLSDRNLLKNVLIVDSFQKKEEPFNRITYRLHFQRDDRTLEREEVDKEMETIVSRLPFERV